MSMTIETTSVRKLNETEAVQKIEREYNNAVIWNEKNWNRNIENWRMYWGLDSEMGLGQWPSSVVSELLRDGRQIAQYNICRPIVDNIAGGILKSPFKFDFSPVDSDITTLTDSVKDANYCDRELMDWRSHDLESVIGGLIFQSVMQIYISREYNRKFGNIGIRTLLPGQVLFDPYWRSPRSKDCKKAWKTSWLTPLEMIDLVPDKKGEIMTAAIFKQYGKDAIKALAEFQSLQGDEYGENYGIFPFPNNEDIWGTKYKIIEYYHMETVKYQYEYCLDENGEQVIIPSELKDPAEKINWLNANCPGWVPDAVFTDEDSEEIQYKTIIAPSFSSGFILASGPTEIQCSRLEFFPWSASRVNGEVGGIIDAIKDAQRTINYWESLMTHKIQVEGGGGAQFADPNDFINEEEYQRYVKQRNNPRAVFKLKRGVLRTNPNGPVVPVTKSPFPAEAMQHLQHIIELIVPRISKTVPASQGMAESSNESGILYRQKQLQVDIERFTLYEGRRNFWNEVGEAYLFQAARTYGNKIERAFYNPRTKKSFKINQRRTRIDESGNTLVEIVNDFSKLREIRHKVMVVESEDSPTRKIEVMQTAAELLKNQPPEKALTRQELAHVLAKQLDSFSEEEKQRLDEYHQLEMDVAVQQLKTSLATLKQQEAAVLGAGGMVQQAPNGGAPGAGAEPVPRTIQNPPVQQYQTVAE